MQTVDENDMPFISYSGYTFQLKNIDGLLRITEIKGNIPVSSSIYTPIYSL